MEGIERSITTREVSSAETPAQSMENTKLVVQVQPNASRNQIIGFNEGVLSLKIAAPPVQGKANQELIKYLADIFDIPKSQLTIQKGATSRRKLINISNFSQERSTRKITDRLEQNKT